MLHRANCGSSRPSRVMAPWGDGNNHCFTYNLRGDVPETAKNTGKTEEQRHDSAEEWT